MARFNPVACTAEQAQLGEGTRWDDRYSELLHVDILAGRVFRDEINEDGMLYPVRSYEVPGTVGAIAPIQNDDGWMLATGRNISYLRPNGDLRLVAEVAGEATRMNDAACDPQGRFWAGTLANDQHPGGGSLYRLEGDGRAELILDGLTISNGLGWSPDSRTMYLTDSGPGVIHAFRFDPQDGSISDDRVLVDVPEDVGPPDGLTVDAEGDLWVAIYGGGRVQRYSPPASCARSSSCRPNRPPAARSRDRGCTGSMSRRGPKTGPTNNAGPNPARAWSICSRPTQPVSRPRLSGPTQPGGEP